MFERFARRLLDHRLAAAVLVAAVTVVFGVFAARVRPDYSVEHYFPVWDPARKVYDAFKERFPYEDTSALVIVEAPDLFTPEGLARLEALERDLKRLEFGWEAEAQAEGAGSAGARSRRRKTAGRPGIEDVEGPLSAEDIVAEGDAIATRKLFPRAALPLEAIARGRETAVKDKLFRYNLARPDGGAVTIRVVLRPELAKNDDGRRAFYRAARELLACHESPGQRLYLSGLPAIRARFADMIEKDSSRLIPLALLLTLALLYLSFRHLASAMAGLLTILASLVWCYGALGMLGFPLAALTSITPLVVIIISLSDTVHIVHDFLDRLRRGEGRKQAVAASLAEAALPCLLTELTIAAGFLSLLAVNVVAIHHFGIATAAAMLLTWVANMTVLPLVLSVGPERAGPAREHGNGQGQGQGQGNGDPPWAVRTFARFVDWIGRQTTLRPRIVVAVALLVFAAAGVLGSGVRPVYYVFDDLWPGSAFEREIRAAEEAYGGLVPLAIWYETSVPAPSPDGPAASTPQSPVLHPELLRSMDGAAAFLSGFPEVPRANALTDFLRKTHLALAGGEDAARTGGLPASRALAMQELETIDPARLRDLLTLDGRSAAVLAYARDAGSPRVAEMFRAIDAWVAAEQARLDALAVPVRLHATGVLAIVDDVNDTLVGGLVWSFAGAVLVTFLVFCLVLRSGRLALIGLVPNVSPIVLIFGFMALAGITLRPTTVIVFSITLVIADDDTIQFLARFRRHLARARSRARREGRDPGDPATYSQAALSCLRAVGLPMVLTSSCVSLGFLVLLLSGFLGLAHLGLLLGVTLFAAVFADLFLSPILIVALRPPLDTAAEEAALREEH